MSDFFKLLSRARHELSRALRNHKYDKTDAGLYFPAQRLLLGGVFEASVNGGAYEAAPNLVPTEGLNHIVSVALDQGTQKLAFYVSLFSGNVTVQPTWTGANYVANATEFTNYDEANRVLWDKGDVGSGVLSNTASPAVFTIGTGSNTIRGAALLEASAKSATTGVLIAAARFGADKVMTEDEELRIKYTFTATST